MVRKSPKKSIRTSKKSRKGSRRRISRYRMNSSDKVRESPYFKAIKKSGSVAPRVDLKLSTLPEDVLYSISRSLTPRDRSRLVSTSKSIRAQSRSIHEASMPVADFKNIDDMKEYLNYFKYLMAENIPLSKMTINVRTYLNNPDKIEKWLDDTLNVLSTKNFNKLTINLGEIMLYKNYINSYDYSKFKNIHIRTIYMIDLNTYDNSRFLGSFGDMNIDKVICVNEEYEDTEICQYLCKVKTVKLIHSPNLPESGMNFSYFSSRESKTKNIAIINYTQDTLRHFSGMNCVYVKDVDDTPAVVFDLDNVNNLIVNSTREVFIRNSSNIKNLIVCTSNRGISNFPMLNLKPPTVAKNIHLLRASNEAEDNVVQWFVDKGVKVIEEDNPCYNPTRDIFDRFK